MTIDAPSRTIEAAGPPASGAPGPEAIPGQARRWVAPLLIGAVAASAAALAGFAVAEHGPGISPDSTTYVRGARSLAEGSGYRFSVFPPLYPWLISLLLRLGVSATSAACTINFLSLFGVIAIAGHWVLWATRSTRLALAASALAGLSPPLLLVSIHVWTESLFILLTVGSAYLLARHLEKRDVRLLIGAAALMSLALFTRYAGLLFAVAYTLLLIVSGGGKTFRAWRDATLVAVLSVLPIGLWLATRPTRPAWLPSRFDLPDTFTSLLTTLSGWLFSDLITPGIGLPLTGIVLLAATVFGCKALYGWAAQPQKGAVGTTGATAFAGAWGYAFSLCGLASLKSFDQIGDRLLAPAYPLVVLGGVAVFQRLCNRPPGCKPVAGAPNPRGAGSRISTRLFGPAILIWLAVPASGVLDIVLTSRDRGFGYASTGWQGTEVGNFLRTWKPEGILLSNHPAAAYWLTNQKYGRTPRRSSYNAAAGSVPADIEALSKELGGGATVYVVWFDRKAPDYLMPLSDLAERLEFEPFATFRDGRIVKVISVR